MKRILLPIYILTLTLFFQLNAQPKAFDLKCEYHENPMGIDVILPRLYWKLKAEEGEKHLLQTAYRIQVVEDAPYFEERILWDTQKYKSDQSTHVGYGGPIPTSRKKYYWRVKIWDNKGRESEWSQPAFWEMGLLNSQDWKAHWIRAPWKEELKALNPSPMFRKEIILKDEVSKARAYITSHGNYHGEINGKKMTEDLFTPGWTSYKHRLQYQTYDVAPLLAKGENAIGIMLGDGWYRGQFGFSGNWNIYGEKLALLCQIEVTYKNGEKEVFVSDKSWKASTGPIIYSSIYDGELYDAGKEKEGWTKVGFIDKGWASVIEDSNIGFANLIAPQGPPVRRMIKVKPKKLITSPEGERIIDFGQNMVGWVKFNVNGNKGDTIILYHAEVLDKEGNFYTDNLRSAEQKITYVLKGGGKETYEPTFTFQGFRYVKVEGMDMLSLDDFEGIAIYSDMDLTGHFECSDSLVNQLQRNILWGQRGNFLDVPTDCPQRDERMGWTGDAQAFAPTACYNFDAAAFFTKWLGDLKTDQSENGSVPFVIPDVLNAGGSTGWGDAATIIPWTMYKKYGDKRILAQQYESMKMWVGYLEALAGEDHIIQDGFHFGDWLFFIHPTDWNAKPGYTDIDFLATAFFAHSSMLVSKTAKVLGKEHDISKYNDLFNTIKKAFQKEFVSPNGRLSPNSQTAYTLALTFGLLEGAQVEKAVFYLTDNIKKRNHHLSTGFLGTPHLSKVLSDHNQTEIAYKILLQTSYPSWLYPVTRGATTIWERWDGIKPDSTFQTTQMNSFNHYAYGAIGHWLYSEVAGIKTDEYVPGYKKIIIDPHIDPSLTFARSIHHSLYGEISSEWKIIGDMLVVNVTIPPNTTATIHLPYHPEGEKTEEAGSGQYTFEYMLTKAN